MLPKDCLETDRTVYFAGTDRVRTCVLAVSVKVQSVPFPAGSILGFREDGVLWRCRLGGDVDIRSIPCKGNNEIELYPGGKLHSCILSRPVTVSGCPLREDAFTLFHPSGELFRGVLKDKLTRQGFSMEAGTEVCLFEDGRVSSFETGSQGATIQDISLAPGCRVWFHPGGRLKAGTLRDPFMGGGIESPAGSLVWFNENGSCAGYASEGESLFLDHNGNRRIPGR